jgi:hypothetical protein
MVIVLNDNTNFEDCFILFNEEKAIMTYVFRRAKSSLLAMFVFLFFISLFPTKVKGITFTDDLITFSICEHYLFNNLMDVELTNRLTIDTMIYENITFYDYEDIRCNNFFFNP